MVNKAELLKHFQKNPEKYWKVSVFEQEGFVRKVCPVCGKGYWTLNPDRKHCPDPKCGEPYGFIGKKITKQKLDYIQMWKLFEKFFQQHGHTSIPRYPVIARWRDDLYFTIASIVDFQRFDNGVMTFDYPANPLVVPQVCLRFNDIANVGITGRHHTSFVMPGQHAFNWPKEGYWKDECMQLNFEFLTKVLGIPKEEIVYVEELWTMPDFSAFGPYIEAYVRGLELVNSGFMQFTWSNGIKELPMKVIDVGWGLERLTWLSNATYTGYDAVFSDHLKKFESIIGRYDRDLFNRYAQLSGRLDFEEVDVSKAREELIKKLGITDEEYKKSIEPLQAMYAVLDHTRTLIFAIADGALPSNTGAGYYLRLIFRRALNFIKKFGWNLQLGDVATWDIKYLKPMFPELKEKQEDILRILEVEGKKFNTSGERARKIIVKYKGAQLRLKDLVQLYDSHGITPEDLGMKATAEFYKLLAEKHPQTKKKEERKEIDVSGIKETEILFYKPIYEFKAKVLKVLPDNWVALDKTAFYPTQGGQLHDIGKINGFEVVDVKKVGRVVLHKVNGKLKEGEEVFCSVDVDRRLALTRHHDAVHIVNGLMKELIGSWCNQAGSEVRPDSARLDVTHYESLNEEEIERIERTANEIVFKALPIIKSVLPRIEAEQKYGFGIYQGGYVPAKHVRIVEIPGVDIEACGGTHGDNTKDINLIVITKVKKISDAVVRIELKAGKAAEKWLREKEMSLKKSAELLDVKEEKLPEAVEKLFKRWKKLRKISKQKFHSH